MALQDAESNQRKSALLEMCDALSPSGDQTSGSCYASITVDGITFTLIPDGSSLSPPSENITECGSTLPTSPSTPPATNTGSCFPEGAVVAHVLHAVVQWERAEVCWLNGRPPAAARAAVTHVAATRIAATRIAFVTGRNRASALPPALPAGFYANPKSWLGLDSTECQAERVDAEAALAGSQKWLDTLGVGSVCHWRVDDWTTACACVKTEQDAVAAGGTVCQECTKTLFESTVS